MASINFIGNVVDSISNEGLPSVNVLIYLNGKFSTAFTSDFDGVINADVNLEIGTYEFRFSYTGSKNKILKRKITPTTQQINFNTVKLDPVVLQEQEVEVSGKVFNGKIIDGDTLKPIPGATIISSKKAPEFLSSETKAQGGKRQSQTDGKFNIVVEPQDSLIKQKKEKETDIDTVVVGGVSYATAKWMEKQWKNAGLSSDNVEFINYNNKQQFKDAISKPTIRYIMGFSAGGKLIWPEIDSDFDFIGLIDPSAPDKVTYLSPNVILVSNSNNWISYKDDPPKSYLYNNLLSMERNGVSAKWDIKHKEMPLKFFQTYKKKFNAQDKKNVKTNITYGNWNFTISAEGYGQAKTPAVKGDGTLQNDLGTIKLFSIEKDLAKEIQNTKQLSIIQEEILNENSPKDFVKSTLKKLFGTIQDRLIPVLLKQIATFGITKFNEEVLNNINNLPKMCPPNIGALNKIIKKKNQLTKQLNNIYSSINSINKFLEIPEIGIEVSEKIMIAAKIGYAIQSSIPSTVTTPNPPGPILKVKDLIDKLEDLIDTFKEKIGVGTIQLKLIIEELKKVLTLLNILDALIQSCAEEMGETPTEQTLVSNELLNSTQNQSQQLSPVVTNVNGFEMSAITVDNIIVGGLKRRRAIARNKSGVIMLQGEPSFSSNDQILIDELVFYIQQNDLKA